MSSSRSDRSKRHITADPTTGRPRAAAALSPARSPSPPPRAATAALAPMGPSPRGRSRAPKPLAAAAAAAPAEPSYESPAARAKARTLEREKAEERSLLAGAGGGSLSAQHGANNVTAHLLKPLKPGADNRGYVTDKARRAIERQVKKDEKTFPSLAEAGKAGYWPAAAVNAATKGGGQYYHFSSRRSEDGYQKGADFTYTPFDGISAGKRNSAHTPRPSSPDPRSTREQLNESRYEHAHQGPFSFTGNAGSTVHAPTQANQAVDTLLEAHARQAGGALFRYDTYRASSIYAAVRQAGGSVTIQRASYMRRSAAAAAPAAVTPSSAAAAASPPTTGHGKKRPRG
jgi:hypothetical protein